MLCLTAEETAGLGEVSVRDALARLHDGTEHAAAMPADVAPIITRVSRMSLTRTLLAHPGLMNPFS